MNVDRRRRQEVTATAGLPPNLADLIERAIQQGWRVRRTAKNHFQLLPPDPSKPIILCASTPRDPTRDRANTLARMKASGFKEP
jgi:hypothetical protein